VRLQHVTWLPLLPGASMHAIHTLSRSPRTLAAATAAHGGDALYFRADADATYASRFTIDLGDVAPQVALYPSPDNCVPVSVCVR